MTKIHDIGDMQAIQVERVKHFFTHYKDLEPGKWAKISHVGGYEDAKKVDSRLHCKRHERQVGR